MQTNAIKHGSHPGKHFICPSLRQCTAATSLVQNNWLIDCNCCAGLGFVCAARYRDETWLLHAIIQCWMRSDPAVTVLTRQSLRTSYHLPQPPRTHMGMLGGSRGQYDVMVTSAVHRSQLFQLLVSASVRLARSDTHTLSVMVNGRQGVCMDHC